MQRTFVLIGSSALFLALVACSGSDKSSGNTTTTAGTTSPDGGTNKPKLGGSAGSSGGTKTPTTPTKDAGSTKPPAPAPGTKTCKQAALCIDACANDDFDCQSTCLDNMSDAENKKLQQVSLCIGESGCNDDECVQEVCADQIAACIGD
jgi:hypothetical protein